MSKPNDIPQDIWDISVDIYDAAAYHIARAILDEREACAQMAEMVGIPMAANGEQVLMIPVRIASRIRSRSGQTGGRMDE